MMSSKMTPGRELYEKLYEVLQIVFPGSTNRYPTWEYLQEIDQWRLQRFADELAKPLRDTLVEEQKLVLEAFRLLQSTPRFDTADPQHCESVTTWNTARNTWLSKMTGISE